MNDTPQEIPADANEHCPGPESDQAGKQSGCEGCPNQQTCASGEVKPDESIPLIESNLKLVKHRILVLSGKGGVGKFIFIRQIYRFYKPCVRFGTH